MKPDLTHHWLACGLRHEHLDASLDALDAAGRKAAEVWLGEQGTAFLLITGPNGTGKSFLAAALLKQHGLGVFATMPELLQLQRTLPFERDGGGATKGRLTNTLKTCPILVIDEIGRTAGGVDENQMLDDVLSFRADRRLRTVLISNLPPKKVSDYLGAAIADRVKESLAILPLTGPSRRGANQPAGPPRNTRMFSGVLPTTQEQDPDGWALWLTAQGRPYKAYRYELDFIRQQFAKAQGK